MKLTLCLAAVAALAMPVRAQIDGPPETIDYQGRVLDALGDPVAAGGTENVEMYFRIWNHISNGGIGDLLWAEKQVVTVADGNFSVRLGEGDQIESSAGDNVVLPGNDDPRPSLLTVFDGNERFLGVSVAPNSITKPSAEILPRLAFLTTPYAAVAEKARFAEFGPSSGTFEADLIGIGTSSPGSLLEVVGLNALSPTNGSGLISSGPISGNHIAFDANDIQSYVNNSTPGVLRLNDHGGNIDMGSPGTQTRIDGDVLLAQGDLGLGVQPTARLDILGLSQGGRFRIYDQAVSGGTQLIGAMTGFFGGAQMRFEGAGGYVDIGQNSAGDFVVESTNSSPRMVVLQNGRVGIGTSSPSDTLTVGNSGDLRLNGGNFKPLGTQSDGVRWVDAAGTIQAHVHRFGSVDNRLYFTNAGGLNLTGLYIASGATFFTSTSDERLKSNIEPITGILDKIEDIRVVGFDMAGLQVDPTTGKTKKVIGDRAPRKTKDGKVIKQEIGSIAQDWIKDFPELVIEPVNDEDHYGLAYDRIGIVALGAAKELHQQIKERDERIADLEARLSRLEGLLQKDAAALPARK